jgi:DNA (cytosine-5)-methyltransferase 1
MFFEATRIIREMRDATRGTYPRVVVWENVPGALSSNQGADFQAVIDEMADSGSLLTEWAVLDAQHFGVPQRRRRIFLVAVLDPAIASRCPDPLLPVAEGRRGDYTKGVTTGQDIAGTLGSSIAGCQSTAVKAKRAMSNTDFDRWEETDLCPTLNSFDNGGESRATVIAFTAQRLGEAPRIYEDSTPALLSRMGTGGNNTPMVGQPACDAIGFNWQNGGGYGNANPGLGITIDGVGPLSTSQVPAVAAEYLVRRLTPLECERLMGWPDDHTRYKADGTEQADTHRYKQCGNGVATPVARWVARQIMEVLRG